MGPLRRKGAERLEFLNTFRICMRCLLGPMLPLPVVSCAAPKTCRLKHDSHAAKVITINIKVVDMVWTPLSTWLSILSQSTRGTGDGLSVMKDLGCKDSLSKFLPIYMNEYIYMLVWYGMVWYGMYVCVWYVMLVCMHACMHAWMDV